MITQEMESRIAALTAAIYEAVLATTDSPTRLAELRSSWEAVEGHLRSLVEALAEERTPSAAMKGWRLVPEEPTTEMIDAAFVWSLDREKLRAAIQAAPEPPIARMPLPDVPRP